MEKDIKLNVNELDKVSGGNYGGPIALEEIDERARLLDMFRNNGDLEGAYGLALESYYDLAAAEVFRTQGGAAWAEYVKAHYDP